MSLLRPRLFLPELALRLALVAGCPAALLAQQTGGGSVPSTSSPGTFVFVNSGATIYPNDPTELGLQIQLRDEYFSKRIEREYLDQLGQDHQESDRSASLPPALPVLDEPVSAGATARRPSEYRDLLVAYAGDAFFMASTSLHRQDQLSAARMRRLAAFAAARKKNLADLEAALRQSRDLPAGDQPGFLASFAHTQAPALLALEAEEEAIRLELTTRAAFRQYEDGVHLPVTQFAGAELPPVAIRLLFAIQFEAGLTATQRELLQGVVQDLGPPSKPAAASFSFWPARIRLHLPAALPADLTAQIQRLQQLKQHLVLDLLELLNRKPDPSRQQALSALAAKQAPTFELLNALAEEIRPRLTGLYQPVVEQPVDASPELLHQVGRAYARKVALQHDVTAELRDLRRLRPNDKFELVQHGQIPSIVFTPGAYPDKTPKLMAAENQALRDRLATANHELERLTLILTKESQELQKSLREYRDKILQAPDRDLNQLAISLGEALTAQENERLYRDYRAAVLQPGLSLEQRRLLLRGTLVDIERARLRDPWAE